MKIIYAAMSDTPEHVVVIGKMTIDEFKSDQHALENTFTPTDEQRIVSELEGWKNVGSPHDGDDDDDR